MKRLSFIPVAMIAAGLLLAVACGGETVIETVVVEKQVQVPGEKVVETVIVEKEVAGEKVVETVVVEKIVVATPTVGPVSAPVTQLGRVVAASLEIGHSPSTLPRDCPECQYVGLSGAGETLLHTVRAAGGFEYTPRLAESWELASDMSYTDFKIRKGVQFHKGFGEMTAEDVAWTYNEGNPSMTPSSVHSTGGEMQTFMSPDKPAEVLSDGQTVRLYWKNYSLSTTYDKVATQFWEPIPIFSKKAQDEMGEAWMRSNSVTTGPFEMIAWVQDSRMDLEAVPDHWRHTASYKHLTILQIPEPTVRRAMLETGEAQIAEVQADDVPALLSKGFKKGEEAANLGFSIISGGNYWEKVHPHSGNPLTRTIPDRPWTADPDDAAAMEKAQKVRWALSMAIDREGIAEGLFKGLANVTYVGGVDSLDPLYMARVDQYTIPYDPVGAKQMLADAGYPNGFSGYTFYVRDAGDTRDRIGQAVVAGWRQDLNVVFDVDNSPYDVYRPLYINRETFDLSFRSGGSKELATWANDWYISATSSNQDGSPGGGFNSGIEIPKASEVIKKKAAAKNNEELAAATYELMDYLHETQVWIATIDIRSPAVYDPKKICAWDLAPTSNPIILADMETIVLCK